MLGLYCNVIYLVGAAWAPLGLLAVDRLVRLKQRRALLELAAVLALQVLGGDPETAYLVVVCGALYALGLAWSESPPHTRGRSPRPEPSGRVPPGRSRDRRGLVCLDRWHVGRCGMDQGQPGQAAWGLAGA